MSYATRGKNDDLGSSSKWTNPAVSWLRPAAFADRQPALFGFRFHEEVDVGSDVDIAVIFDASVRRNALAHFGIHQRIEDRLFAILGLRVDLSDEAMQPDTVRKGSEHDRIAVF